jgi:ribosomal protein L4
MRSCFDAASKGEMKVRENLNIASKMKTKVLRNVLKNTKADRRVLFGRRSAGDMSLFEEMLLTSRGSSFVNYAWNEFRLWELPDMLIMVRN